MDCRKKYLQYMREQHHVDFADMHIIQTIMDSDDERRVRKWGHNGFLLKKKKKDRKRITDAMLNNL